MSRQQSVWGSVQDVANANLFERELFGHSSVAQRGARRFTPQQPARLSRGSLARHESEYAIEAVDERIIGDENRVQVTARDTHPSTTLFPFNTICFIEQTATLNASGTLIAPRVVLTARHVLEGTAQVTIVPGADLSATGAARQRPAAPQSQVVASANYVLHPTLDLGLAFCPAKFTRPNRFMRLQDRGNTNTATLLTNAGYPRVPPNGVIRGTMWRHSLPIPITGVTDTRLTYQHDTTVGHSGSPLWLLGNDEIRLLLGVHTNGPAGADNFGVRIRRPVIDWILNACRTAGVDAPTVA